MTVGSDPHYQSMLDCIRICSATVDAVYVNVVPWSEFSIVSSYPHICSAMVGVPYRPLLPSYM